MLLFLSEFLLGSLAFVFRGGIGRMLAHELKYGIEKHYNVSDRGGFFTPSVASIWDKLQVDVSSGGLASVVKDNSLRIVSIFDHLASMLWCFVVRRLARYQCVARRAMGTAILLSAPVRFRVSGRIWR